MFNRLNQRQCILVTGGLGFIGSHFVQRMLHEGHDVINIDKCTYAANMEMNEVFKQYSGYSFINADISTLTSLPLTNFIVNFAAESHVDNSISANDIFMQSNVLGPHRLLELLKNSSLEHKLHGRNFRMPIFVQISTDEVFGDIHVGSFDVDAPHKPSNPYAATKSCAEQLVVSWGRTYDIPYIITRTTNNYGPRQHREKLIPNVISRLLSGQHVIVHGNGSYVRNWIHVDDNIDAICTLLNNGDLNRSYHIASSEELSVRDIVELLCQKFNVKYNDVVDMSMDRAGADVRYALDTISMQPYGWNTKRDMLTSLDQLIASYTI